MDTNIADLPLAEPVPMSTVRQKKPDDDYSHLPLAEPIPTTTTSPSSTELPTAEPIPSMTVTPPPSSRPSALSSIFGYPVDPETGTSLNPVEQMGPAQMPPAPIAPPLGYTQVTEPPPARHQGPIDSAIAGITDAFREGRQMATGDTFTYQPPLEPEPERSWLGRTLYGVSHSTPTISAALLGAGAGAATGTGPVGMAAGAALGGGAMSAMQALVPAYQEARNAGLDHDAAVDRALITATVQGGVGGLMGAAGGWAPLKSILGNFMLQIGAVQPGIGAAGRIATPLATGQPLPDAGQMAEGYLTDVVVGGAFAGPHAARRGYQQWQNRPVNTVVTPGEGPPPPVQGTLPGPDGGGGAPTGGGATGDQLGLPAPQPTLADILSPRPEPIPAPAPPPLQLPAPDPNAPTVPVPAQTDQPSGLGGRLAVAQPRLPTGDIPPDVPVQVDPTGAATVVGSPAAASPVPAPVVAPAPAAPAPVQPSPPVQDQTPTEPVPSGATAVETLPIASPVLPVTAPVEVGPPAPAVVPPVEQPAGGVAGPSTEIVSADTQPVSVLPPAETGAAGGQTTLQPGVSSDGPLAQTEPQQNAPVTQQIATGATTNTTGAAVGVASGAPAETAAGTGGTNVGGVGAASTEAPGTGTGTTGPVPTDLTKLSPEELHAEVYRRGETARLAEDEVAHTHAFKPNSPELKAAMAKSDAADAAFMEARRVYDALPDREFTVTFKDYGKNKKKFTETEHTFKGKTADEVMTEQKRLAEKYTKDTGRRLEVSGIRPSGDQPVPAPVVKTAPATPIPAPEPTPVPEPVTAPVAEPAPATEPAGQTSEPPVSRAAAILAELKARNAPDIEYRKAFSTAQRTPLKLGETWRGRLEAWVAREANQASTSEDIEADIKDAEKGNVTGYEIGARSILNQMRTRNASKEEAETLRLLEAGTPWQDTYRAIAQQFPDGDLSAANIRGIASLLKEEAATPKTELGKINKQVVDELNKQITRLQENIDRLEAMPASEMTRRQAQDLVNHKKQLPKLIAKRDKLAGTMDTSAAGDESRRSRNRLGRRMTPAPTPGERTLEQHLEDQSGASPYNGVFRDAGYDPAAAVNYPMKRQIEIIKQQTIKKLNLRNIQVEAGYPEHEVRDLLSKIYRNGQEMMSALLRPNSALGNGKLTLRLVRDTGQNTLGSYHRGTKVLTLTGTNQTLGHEWAHAEDNEMVLRLTKAGTATDMASILARTKGLNPNASVEEAIAHVVNTLFFDGAELALRQMSLEIIAQDKLPNGLPTTAAKAARKELDRIRSGRGGNKPPLKTSRYYDLATKLGDPRYWASVQELWARAREAHIAHRLSSAGIDPHGVVMQDRSYTDDTHRRLNEAYPQAEERIAIFQAFDAYDAAVEREAIYAGPVSPGSNDPGLMHLLTPSPTPPRQTFKGSLRTSVAHMKDWRNTISDMSPFDPNRPASAERRVWTRVADVGRMVLYTKGTLVEIVAERARTPGARNRIMRIRDLMGARAGTGAYAPESFHERRIRHERKMMAEYTALLEHTGVRPNRMDDAKLREIDDALTSGVVTGLSQAEKDYVQGLRLIMNRAYDRLKNSNHDVNQLGQYRPRMFDKIRVNENSNKFVSDASDMYSRMFDDDTDPGSPEHADNLLEQWRDQSAETRNAAPQHVQDVMNEIRDKKREANRLVREMEANLAAGVPVDVAKVSAQVDQLHDEANQLAAGIHNELREYIATTAAQDWKVRLLTAAPHEFNSSGANGNYLKRRKLPPYADEYMKDFLNYDLTKWVPQYLSSVARAQAKSEVWGIGWEKLNALLDGAMNAQDPVTGRMGLFLGDDARVRDAVHRSVDPARVPDGQHDAARIVAGIQAVAALTQLGRTPISLLSEFSVGAMSYGSVKVAGKNLINLINQIRDTGDARAITDLANAFGITVSIMHAEAMMDRFSMDYADTPSLAKWMDRFFRANGMTAITTMNQRAAMATGHWLAHTMALRYLEGNPGPGSNAPPVDLPTMNSAENAVRFFNEHGVPTNRRRDYAEWLMAHEVLTTVDPDDPMAEIHRLVLFRATERQVLTADPVNTPLHAEHYLGRLPMQYMNYLYQFQKQILDRVDNEASFTGLRAYRQAREQGAGRFGANVEGAAASLGVWGAFVGGIAVATMAQFVTTLVREMLYNQAGWDKHTEDDDIFEWLMGLAFQRTGIGGTIDPLVQLITSLKYSADISSIIEGTGINSLTREIQGMLAPLLKPETDTNANLYESARNSYSLIAAPTIAMAGTYVSELVGGAWGMAIGSAIIQAGTSRMAADTFATATMGPRGAKPADASGVPKMPAMPGMPEMPKMPQPGDKPSKEKGAHIPSGTASVLGVVDDVAIPVARRMGPIWTALPTPVKAVMLAGGGIYGAASWWGAGAEYRDQPAPDRKHR